MSRRSLKATIASLLPAVVHSLTYIPLAAAAATAPAHLLACSTATYAMVVPLLSPASPASQCAPVPTHGGVAGGLSGGFGRRRCRYKPSCTSSGPTDKSLVAAVCVAGFLELWVVSPDAAAAFPPSVATLAPARVGPIVGLLHVCF